MNRSCQFLFTFLIVFTASVNYAAGVEVDFLNETTSSSSEMHNNNSDIHSYLTAPDNDEACGAILLECNSPSTYTYDLSATTSPEIAGDYCNLTIDPYPWDGPEGDVWFKFTADGNSSYAYSVSLDIGRAVALYKETGSECENLQLVEHCETFPESTESTVYSPGTYYISVRPYLAAPVAYQVELICENNPPNLEACTDPEALNYAPQAIINDGSCIYAPANDEPCGALPLICNGEALTGTFDNATSTVIDACFGFEIGDVWFSFEADGTSFYTINSEFDAVPSLYTADECTDQLIELIPCNSNFSGVLTVSPEVGTYYVRLRRDSWYSDTNYALELQCTQAPENGTACTAEEIDCNVGIIIDSNAGAPLYTNCANQGSCPGVWYVYTAAFDGTLSLNACDNAPLENPYFNNINAYTGTCDDLTCYDFSASGCFFKAKLTMDVDSGQTYYIMFAGTNPNAQGVFNLAVTCTPDACAEPLGQVTGLSVQYTPQGVQGSWVPEPGAVVCQHRLRRVSDGEVLINRYQQQFEADSIVAAYSNFEPNTTYQWGIRCSCAAISTLAGPWSTLTFTTPSAPQLISFPNPTSQISTVTFSVVAEERATLAVYDMSGRRIAELYAGQANPETNMTFEFDASDQPPGVYVYRLTTESSTIIEKFIVSK